MAVQAPEAAAVNDGADRDERFMELLEKARNKPRGEREAFLREQCRDDPRMAEELIECLYWQDQMGDFMAQPLIPRMEPELPFGVGDLVCDQFQIVRQVGYGGMGVVFEAIDTLLKRRCALKCARPGFAERLPPEVLNLIGITHDNVCRVYGFYTAKTDHGPVEFLTMEFIEGETLSAHLAKSGPLPPAKATAIARQISEGLAAVHRNGVLHRDLKSNNVMLTFDSNGSVRAVITDFGLAKAYSESERTGATAPSELAGAESYMAPEVRARQSATRQSDIYSLGVVLHEMLTGQVPNRASGIVPTVRARRLRRIVKRCLARDPKKRYSSAADLSRALSAGAGPIWVRAAVVVFAVVLSAAAFLWTRAGGAGPPPARVAILPFTVAAGSPDAAEMVGGLLHDVSDRLSSTRLLRGSLVVIPYSEALRSGVARTEQARARLGATHGLTGTVERINGTYQLRADLTDAQTLVSARTLNATYAATEVSAIPDALTGIVTAGLRLRAEPKAQTMDPAVYAGYARGVFHLRAGLDHTEASLRALQQTVELDPRSPVAWAALAEALCNKHLITGDQHWLDAAREALAKAESRQPDLAAVWLASGRVSRALGWHDKATQDYSRAIELEPHNALAWVGLARAYQAVGNRRADAAAAFQKAVDLQPEFYLPHLAFGGYYQLLGQYTAAEKHLRRAIEIAPDLARGYLGLGGLYTDMGRDGEAEAMLRRSLELDESSEALQNLGALLNYQRRDAEALAYYRRALARSRPNYVLMLNIADTCRRLNRPTEAQDAYRRGFLLADQKVLNDPRDGYTRSFVAYFAARLGNRSTARREIEQALRLAPHDGKVVRRAVLTYESLGERNRAVRLLEQSTPDVLRELSRHPDLADFRGEPRVQALISESGKR